MKLLEELCKINAVSGNEDRIYEFISNELKNYVSDIYMDNMSNIIALIDNGSEFNIMLDAHIDQIGLVVKSIDENGFVKFICSGGIDESILPTAEAVIHGKKDIYGIIGAKPPHLLSNEEIGKNKKVNELYIDCGYDFDTLKNLISAGNTISLVSDYKKLKNGLISSKSLDNRIGVYIVTECMKKLSEYNLPFNITALFSSQEEVGCRGALIGAKKIKPDICIVVDVTFGVSSDTDEEHGFALNDGITIAVGPNLNRKVNDVLFKICEKYDIKYKKEVCSANTGTNAWPVQVIENGIMCGLVSVPIRYMHTTVETASLNDVNSAVKLICKAFTEGFLC